MQGANGEPAPFALASAWHDERDRGRLRQLDDVAEPADAEARRDLDRAAVIPARHLEPGEHARPVRAPEPAPVLGAGLLLVAHVLGREDAAVEEVDVLDPVVEDRGVERDSGHPFPPSNERSRTKRVTSVRSWPS